MAYDLILTAPGGGSHRDLTRLVSSITWSGSIKQVARQLKATICIPKDGSVTPPDLAEGSALTLRMDGTPVFTGPLLTATTDSTSSLVDLAALDNGRFLIGNQGWYKFVGASPQGAASAVCGDFGIPVARLASAPGTYSRKFAGVDLDRILRTMYNLSGDATGKQYLIRFTGDGALEVIEKPTAASLTIQSTMGVINTWSVENLSNSVAIYSDTGALIRTVDDGASIAKNGRLSHVLVQRSGEDVSDEASAWLREHGISQAVTVETLGDPRLLTGNAVLLKDTGSGVSGLFWIDADTHTFKNHNYYAKVTLNFRSIVDSSLAGSEVK